MNHCHDYGQDVDRWGFLGWTVLFLGHGLVNKNSFHCFFLITFFSRVFNKKIIWPVKDCQSLIFIIDLLAFCIGTQTQYTVYIVPRIIEVP